MNAAINQELYKALMALLEKDQATRQRLLQEGRLYGQYDAEMQAVHIDNANALNDLVEQYGWPGIGLVGLEGCRVAWQLAQHAIMTPDLQRKFLDLLTQAAQAGDVPMRQAAMLEDRVRFNEGKPQRYGTVLDWTEQGSLGCELENPQQVDERRTAVGLPPLAESLEREQRAIIAEGGERPADFEAYRQAGETWAKKVGWR